MRAYFEFRWLNGFEPVSLFMDSLRTGAIVFETRQWLQDGLCRHQCAKRYSGFPPTSTSLERNFLPMMILI